MLIERIEIDGEWCSVWETPPAGVSPALLWAGEGYYRLGDGQSPTCMQLPQAYRLGCPAWEVGIGHLWGLRFLVPDKLALSPREAAEVLLRPVTGVAPLRHVVPDYSPQQHLVMAYAARHRRRVAEDIERRA